MHAKVPQIRMTFLPSPRSWLTAFRVPESPDVLNFSFCPQIVSDDVLDTTLGRGRPESLGGSLASLRGENSGSRSKTAVCPIKSEFPQCSQISIRGILILIFLEQFLKNKYSRILICEHCGNSDFMGQTAGYISLEIEMLAVKSIIMRTGLLSREKLNRRDSAESSPFHLTTHAKVISIMCEVWCMHRCEYSTGQSVRIRESDECFGEKLCLFFWESPLRL